MTALLLLPLVLFPSSAQATVRAATRPNIVFYNLDDLRDAVPGGIDPMTFMPKTRGWLSAGTRYTTMFVADPACCPSRASMMTGRYPHNNGVELQAEARNFDAAHSMACYLSAGGYATYIVGKFLTSWPRSTVPPCFDHSTVMWGGYNDVAVKIDGGPQQRAPGYSTTYLGVQGRRYVREALALGRPFLLYEAPHAPHWSTVTEPDGTTVRLAIPEPKYADTPVGRCAGPVEADRSDKPPYVLLQHRTVAQSQQMCASQLRAIMTADDEFSATMQLLANSGVLDNTLVIFSSDNGYMWGEHGRTEKFVPYEPSIRVPLYLRWPGHVPAGPNDTRTVSYLDLLPTMLAAAGVAPPSAAPPLDGESLLSPSRRGTMYSEYFADPANGHVPTWKMVRTRDVKYIETYDPDGTVSFREYYDLSKDPTELTNLLADGTPVDDPPAWKLRNLAATLQEFATCTGEACVR